MHKSISLHRCAALLLGAVLAFLSRPGLAQSPEPLATPLSLAQALELALARSPSLGAARADVAVARADLRTARAYPFNPVIEGTLARRRTSDGPHRDQGLAVSQEIELGGQRGKRTTAARADLTAAERVLVHSERLLAAQVESAYAEAVKARELLKIDTIDVELARTHEQHAKKRLDAGAGTQIENNLATATLGRAERQLRGAEAAHLEALSILAEVVGLGRDALPEPTDSFPQLPPEPPQLSAILDAAIDNRADIQAFKEMREAAQVRIRLASSEAFPNLVVRGFYDREGSGDSILGGGIGIAIPVFNRNQGGIAARQAELERTRAAMAVLELAASREVSSAYFNLRAARAMVEGLRTNVMGSLEENLELLQSSFAAGKIGGTDVLLFRREFIDAQREYIVAQGLVWQMRVALDLAAGRPTGVGNTDQEAQP